MTPSADQSARILTEKIRKAEPFIYVRLGDADIPWMMGRPGVLETCDGELNRAGLGAELMDAWRRLCGSPLFECGDLLTMDDPADPQVRADWLELCRPYPTLNFLHSEALLIHRLSGALLDFYRAVRHDPRRKVLVSPHRISGAAELLGAEHVAIHSTHANEPAELARLRWYMGQIAKDRDNPGIVLIAGGRASKILAADYVERGVTVVELGSALDPLYYGTTRTRQIGQHDARCFFSTLFWESPA